MKAQRILWIMIESPSTFVVADLLWGAALPHFERNQVFFVSVEIRFHINWFFTHKNMKIVFNEKWRQCEATAATVMILWLYRKFVFVSRWRRKKNAQIKSRNIYFFLFFVFDKAKRRNNKKIKQKKDEGKYKQGKSRARSSSYADKIKY
jgi:hypothetical protein